ncbi:hypothetical protein FSU_0335 [Fibrobacter succinogenes subsp. succinogenes S85]|uniref:DUF2279 domain-containing protein n=1 Tax=Fibrobacter succinogenes (strain ATCC 19169 / S85) TaxID=59374 RepID=C9RPW7_FIBSS|nr:hypothetical protein [Fibrobacter succinogenes]ACX76649.1 hypothetical protein Fisuc_3069 [Fibrobacter succinogenes subsp. succinogenes S85]ADL26212.1 hypothetical protein FSU_0335 [Fibrobacter succinogenes subsp. succinogenes S85]
MRKANSSAIGSSASRKINAKICAFLLMLSLVFPAAALSSPGDPLTWRDSTWDYRSEDPTDIKSEIEPAKLFGVASLTLIAYGAAYGFVFEKGWWDDNGGRGFHWENDFDYALNLDKFGHFAAGVVIGESFYEGYRWAGASEFQSYLFAGLTALATHIAIDIKDGFAPSWGFSIFDVLSGGLGGFLPMAERYVPVFKYIDLKWSYWINSNAYYDQEHQASGGVFTDDYVNQTFWLSVKPYRLLPESARRYYPSWLAFAIGLSIDDKVFTGEPHPRREVYLALDYDLEAFRPQSRLARYLVKMLNYFKLPAPTIQVYPEFHWYLLYPIKF